MIELHHPATGNTITVPDERVAAIHAESGWVIVPTADEQAVVERPAEGAPPRKWLAYAAAIGLEVDETSIGSVEQLIALIDGHAPADPNVPPDHADELIAWIGDDPERARLADEAESERPAPRKTVTEHIASVLNPSQED